MFISCLWNTSDDEADIDELLNVAATEGMPTSLVGGSVCAISGAYVISDLDLAMEGPEKLTLQRFYCSQRIPANLATGWSINHTETVKIRGGPLRGGGAGCMATVKNPNGSALQYYHSVSKKFPDIYSPSLIIPAGLTNVNRGEISARTNVKNDKLTVNQPEKSCQIITGDGTKKFFYFNEKEKSFFESQRNTPGGLVTKYVRKDKTTRIGQLAPDGLEYGWANFSTTRSTKENSLTTVQTSSGQSISYHFMKEKVWLTRNKAHRFKYLTRVERTSGPTESYEYVFKNDHEFLHISKKQRPDGRFQAVSYYAFGVIDWRSNRVKEIQAPVGTDQTPITTHRFVYEASFDANKVMGSGSTDVYNAYGVKSKYFYDNQQRLFCITKYDPQGNHYSSDHSIWGADNTPQKGNLIGKLLSDSDHRVLYAKTFDYDDRGNILKEVLYGNLTGKCTAMALDGRRMPIPGISEQYVKRFTYTQDGLNLLTRTTEDDSHQMIYTYHPGSDRVAGEFMVFGGIIRKRTFYDYDQKGVLSLKIVDDGCTQSKDNLAGVTERHITRLWGRLTEPVGVPERIDELYFDLASGQEVLIKRTQAEYSIDGKMLKQDVYGSDGAYCYSLFWDYDRHGNLLSHTDAIGEKTVYQYDANDNKISEQDNTHHVLYQYDYSNRLIRQDEHFRDVTCLTTTYRYDYLWQLHR